MVFGWFNKKGMSSNQVAPQSPEDATIAAELSDELHGKIKDLCARGDEHAAAREFELALPLYWQAFDLLPQPTTRWDAGTWILTAIGDANFLGRDFTAGRDNLSTAMHYPDAIGNPFIHLRLGQCQLELGNLDRAADELARAYIGAGAEIFAQDSSKYFDFLKTRLEPPASGQW